MDKVETVETVVVTWIFLSRSSIQVPSATDIRLLIESANTKQIG